MQGDPDWVPWLLQGFHPPTCGSHTYVSSNNQIGDARKMGEKAFRSTGKFQVLHHHQWDERCVDTCEVYGKEVPQLVG